MAGRKREDSSTSAPSGSNNKTTPKKMGGKRQSKDSSRQPSAKPELSGPLSDVSVASGSFQMQNSLGAFVFCFLTVSLILVLALGYYSQLWQQSETYSRSFEIKLTTPGPAWLKNDVCSEALKSHSDLKDLSYDDPDLTERVYLAFKNSPVVLNVVSVSKRFPNTVLVDLEYRNPVAMVSVEKGYYPVDKLSFVLPTDNFVPANISQYIVVLGIKSSPINPIGATWGDVHVETAAQIAGELQPYWKELGVVEIMVHDSVNSSQKRESFFDLRLKNGSLIRWKRQFFNGASLENDPEELPLQEKLSLLRKAKLENNGELKIGQDDIFIFEKDHGKPQANP